MTGLVSGVGGSGEALLVSPLQESSQATDNRQAISNERDSHCYQHHTLDLEESEDKPTISQGRYQRQMAAVGRQAARERLQAIAGLEERTA